MTDPTALPASPRRIGTGLLNVHKPPALTSRDVVNHVQRLVRPLKCGHAGTLDPLAEGVLVLAIGSATRLIQFVQQQRKSYQGWFRLGLRSDTEDIQGTVEPTPVDQSISAAQIEEVLQAFQGPILQTPPAYSALKVRGKRAYEIARGGGTVELAPRTVIIHTVELVSYDFPDFCLRVECGAGTYLRSLGRDIARRLGTEAVMTNLIRSGVGRFELSAAHDLSSITSATISEMILPPAMAVPHLPTRLLTASELQDIHHGRRVNRNPEDREAPLAGFDEQGRLVCLLYKKGDQLQPKCYLGGSSGP